MHLFNIRVLFIYKIRYARGMKVGSRSSKSPQALMLTNGWRAHQVHPPSLLSSHFLIFILLDYLYIYFQLRIQAAPKPCTSQRLLKVQSLISPSHPMHQASSTLDFSSPVVQEPIVKLTSTVCLCSSPALLSPLLPLSSTLLLMVLDGGGRCGFQNGNCDPTVDCRNLGQDTSTCEECALPAVFDLNDNVCRGTHERERSTKKKKGKKRERKKRRDGWRGARRVRGRKLV